MSNASYTISNKKSANDAPENLEDEMLRLLMNPQDEASMTPVGNVSSSRGTKSKGSVREGDMVKYK